MPKPKPDQSVFGYQEEPEEDETAKNPFWQKWLYKTEGDKADIGCLPCPEDINARRWWNRSPTSRVNKKLAMEGITIGKFLPSLTKK